MEHRDVQPKKQISRKTLIQIAIFCCATFLISNLSAIVDSFAHPEIPYFDEEHLIVGGISGLVSGILFGLIILYARHLEQALANIRRLESFLPICCHCKKIRIADGDATKQTSWQPIDTYISEHTATQFSHGICPDCLKKLYPEFHPENETDHHAAV